MNDFKNMLLKYLYDKGYRYIAKDRNRELCAYLYKPFKAKLFWAPDHYNEDLIDVEVFKDLFPEVKWENREPFDIGKYLGIVDWTKVPVDTKVLVREGDDKPWRRAYFAGFNPTCKEYPFLSFAFGNDSWANGETTPQAWGQCKLAEEKD